MLEQDNSKDYVIATDKHYSVRDYVRVSAALLKMELSRRQRRGRGRSQTERVADSAAVTLVVFRPVEIISLLGNSRKVRRDLFWKSKVGFRE